MALQSVGFHEGFAKVADRKLRDGDAVLLVDARGRRYLKRLRSGHRITVRGSIVAADDLIGGDEGARVGSPESFLVFRPLYHEIASAIERPAEPVFAKDAALLLVRSRIYSGARVIEVGVGGGTLTMALLAAIGTHGRLASYELREDLAQAAERSVAAYFGDAPQWSLVIRDGREGFDERDVDAVVSDVPDPDLLLDAVAASLRPGGVYAAYVPTVLQIKQLHDALQDRPQFALPETIEVLERAWHVEGRSIRPEQRMIGHTGFLSFVRRTADCAR
jgi:tRNA (adenine57-N1/adenine58-N1)-methyltransferase